MGSAMVTEPERLTQVDCSTEVSVGVIDPHAVSELVGYAVSLALPHTEADVARSRINIGIMNFSAAGIPELEGFLDGVIADDEADVPKADNGGVGSLVRS